MRKFIILSAGIIASVMVLASYTRKEAPADKAALGKLLFFDPILSRNKTVSCASCHKPAFAFSDTSAVSRGVEGRRGTRNTPSAMNMRLQNFFFWDGRAQSLEEQALAPIQNPAEMDLPIEEAIGRLVKSKAYAAYFKKVFNGPPNRQTLAAALAAFERTLETSNSPFDNWKFSGNPAAVSEAAKQGFIIFNGKGHCVKCHFGADFTQNNFRNIGLFDGKKLNDSGRILISGRSEDLGRFKIGSLRNVAVTAPYMHNGLFKTLDAVIDFYNDPAKVVPGAINRDSLLATPLGLTATEKKALKAFLLSLTDKQFAEKKR